MPAPPAHSRSDAAADAAAADAADDDDDDDDDDGTCFHPRASVDIVPAMIDHLSLRVSDFARLVEFYRAALAPLGYKVIMDFPGATGMGDQSGMPDFWLMHTDTALNPTHLAFSGDRAAVDAFHTAALAAGGTDNGPPGVRADYHPHYYAAFVTDPEGNNIEVVCHTPAGAPAASSSRAAKAKPARKAGAAKKPVKKSAAKRPAKKAPAKKPAARKAPAKKKRR